MPSQLQCPYHPSFCKNLIGPQRQRSIRYGWQPSRLPSRCVCSMAFTVEHTLSCPCGTLPPIRHNEIRDLTAKLLTEVCHNVATEPTLQLLTGEKFSHRTSNDEDGARLDVCAQGFWGNRQSAFFDVRFFNPLAPSNCGHPSPPPTDSTRLQNEEPMNSVFEK